MAANQEDIYSLLIPLKEARLVVPRSNVAEVVRYSVQSTGDQDSWICGSVRWNSHDVPVVSLEKMCGMSVPTPAGRTRICVFHPVTPGMSPYGILSEGFPQMMRISREVLELDRDYTAPADSPILCRVNMLQEQALIPDLEAIEAQLSGY
jgi:chemosensory pili system protein ChpC